MPAIRPAEDLNGKIIGTARLSGSSHISASIAIEHLGLDLKRDKITLIQTGVDRDRMVALKNKAIDAGMLPRVTTKVMTSKGFHNLIDMHGSKLPQNRPDREKDYAAANPQAVDGFTRATIGAYGYIFRKENKQSVKELVAKNLRLKNVEAAEDFYLEARKNSTANPIRLWKGSRSSSNMSPNKTQSRRHQGRRDRRIRTGEATRRREVFHRVYGEVSNTNEPPAWKIIAGFGKTDRL